LRSHDEARHVRTLVKVVPAAMRAEGVVDVIRQLYVFVRVKYEPRTGHGVVKTILAVPWWTVCSVVIDLAEPNDGNRWTETEWIASQVLL
jgi:hypothetical protein